MHPAQVNVLTRETVSLSLSETLVGRLASHERAQRAERAERAQRAERTREHQTVVCVCVCVLSYR